MFSVIFDMDGTLLDTQRIYIAAWDCAGEKQGYKNAGRFVPQACGMSPSNCTRFIKDTFDGIDIKRFIADYSDYAEKNRVVRFKDGAKELLEYLKQRGVKIGLASGSSRELVNSHLEKVDALKFFDVMVCGDEVENGKPAPDIFLKTAELLGADPADCFVFEDSENGINAGFAAGMKCIGIEDIAIFGEEAKKRMFCQLDNLAQAIEIFEKM